MKSAAIRMIIALMTSRKRPNVTMVIGKVRITSMGFTTTLSILSTKATMRAVVKESTPMPGRTYESITTASAFKSSFKISFI